jgi:hypothetical protein
MSDSDILWAARRIDMYRQMGDAENARKTYAWARKRIRGASPGAMMKLEEAWIEAQRTFGSRLASKKKVKVRF